MFTSANAGSLDLSSTWRLMPKKTSKSSSTSTESVEMLDNSTEHTTVSTSTQVDFVFKSIKEEHLQRILVSFSNHNIFNLLLNSLNENSKHSNDAASLYKPSFLSPSSLKVSSILTPSKLPSFLLASSFSSPNDDSRRRNIFVINSHEFHEGWCSHNSTISIYYSNRPSSSTSPHLSYSVPSCVTSIASHPFKPTIFSVGCYDGTIKLVNLARKGDVVISSSFLKVSRHPIIFMSWISDPFFKFGLFCVSNDGFCYFCTLKDSKSDQKSKITFDLRATWSFNNDFDLQSFSSGTITSCCLIKTESPTLSIVTATSSGQISRHTLTMATQDKSLLNTIYFSYSPQKSCISAICSCPFSSSPYFITGSSSFVSLYSADALDAKFTINLPNFSTVVCINWSFSPLLITIGTSEGMILWYLLSDLSKPFEQINLREVLNEDVYATCFEFTEWNDDVALAVSTSIGKVVVLHLSTKLLNAPRGCVESLFP
ncbi:hypothetical protein RCL1_001929 [Eukaryota sp. TZLM3-RCL]